MSSGTWVKCDFCGEHQTYVDNYYTAELHTSITTVPQKDPHLDICVPCIHHLRNYPRATTKVNQ